MGGMFTSREDKHIQQLSVQKRGLVNQLIDNTDPESGIRPQHADYISPLGKINNPDLCRHFDFKDSQSQVLLKDTKFNRSLGFKEKILQEFYREKFSYYDLKQAIKKSFQEPQHFNKCLKIASQRKAKFMAETRTDEETANACCLVISFYTGHFQQQLSRSSNILIKLESMDILQCIKGKKQLRHQMCISYWLLKAISQLPLYINQVTRCINLSQEEEIYYNQGNLITWLQFSSGSQGQFIPYGLQKRNTRFHIFSITSRKIAVYSQFQEAEKQVLFKPFTHFLVLKKEKIDGVLHIYMRQVVIGQASLNILWVDDKIFSPDWQHKKLVETIIRQNPHITIIPKSSTKAAISFMNSSLGSRRKATNLRIITTLARQNEENEANAGVLLLKELEEAYVTNLKILVLSDDVRGVQSQMKRLVVRQPHVTISKNNDILKFFVSFK